MASRRRRRRSAYVVQDSKADLRTRRARAVASCVRPRRSAPGLCRSRSAKGVDVVRQVDINRLENEADRSIGARSPGCSRKQDPIMVIKWKETLRDPRRRRPIAARTSRTSSRASSSSTRSLWHGRAGRRSSAVALVFDFINGFHDAANSIATVVSTRVLSPRQAVVWAAFFNFVAAFIFGTARRERSIGSRHDRRAVRDLAGGLRGARRRDRVGPLDLVLGAADELVARADRRLRRRGGRVRRVQGRSSLGETDEDAHLHRRSRRSSA